MITTYGDAEAIKIFFLELYCADHGGVGYLFALITGDVFVIDRKENICDVDALATSIWSFSYALAEASNFIDEGPVPNFGVSGMVSQFAIF